MLAVTKRHIEASQPEEKIVLPNGIDHLSFSAIETYLGCPMRYKFRYIDGIKSPPAAALEFGSCGHEALELNNVHKFTNKEDLPVKLVTEKFCDEFNTSIKKIEDWGDDTPNDLIKTGQDLLSTYMKEAAPDLLPMEKPEEKKSIEIAGVKLDYVIDLKTEEGIYDYKFVGKNKTDDDVKNSPQMWLYCLAEKVDDVGMISMNKKTKKVSLSTAKINDSDKRWMKEIVRGTAKAICAGAFFPRKPDGMEKWMCTPKFCGYYGICRGRA